MTANPMPANAVPGFADATAFTSAEWEAYKTALTAFYQGPCEATANGVRDAYRLFLETYLEPKDRENIDALAATVEARLIRVRDEWRAERRGRHERAA
jgi:hypothetical protein